MPESTRERFQTYAAYLSALRLGTASDALRVDAFGLAAPPTLTDSIDANKRFLAASRGFTGLQRRAIPTFRRLQRNLKNAWAAELMLYVTAERVPPSGIPLALTWSVVQAYYAHYLATKSLAIANNPDAELRSHDEVQKFNENYWTVQSRFFAPWSLNWNSTGPCLESGVQSERVNALVAAYTSPRPDTWPLFVMKCLKTTRAHEVESRLSHERESRARVRAREHRDANAARIAAGRRPAASPPQAVRLTRDQSVAVDQRVRAYTPLDFLYRLRIQSNYEDALVWSEGVSDVEAQTVLEDLQCLTGCYLHIVESFLSRMLPPDTCKTPANEWLERIDGALPTYEPVKSRIRELT